MVKANNQIERYNLDAAKVWAGEAARRAGVADRVAELQSAPTGYSAVVLPDGTVTQFSELGTPAVLRQEVPLRTGLTPHARTGDWPVLLLTGGAARLVRGRRVAPGRRLPALRPSGSRERVLVTSR